MEREFKVDALIFDIDGVLLDVTGSFPEVIRQAVSTGWERFCGGASDVPGYNAGHERVLKRHGAFNDDYDIAWTLLSMAAASGEKLLSRALPSPKRLLSELESYRRLLTPVLIRICTVFLRLRGYACGVDIAWDNINLQDELELANARLQNLQADKLARELERTEENR